MKDRPVIYARPAPGTRTGRVWEVADTITQQTGRRAVRAEVLERIAEEDGNLATANTQYQHWKSDYDAAARPVPQSKADLHDITEQPLRIGQDGRVVIPQEMREAMLLGEDGRVTARVKAGELRLISRQAAIRSMQKDARRLRKSGESVVDAFLCARRSMWGED